MILFPTPCKARKSRVWASIAVHRRLGIATPFKLPHSRSYALAVGSHMFIVNTKHRYVLVVDDKEPVPKRIAGVATFRLKAMVSTPPR